MTSKIEQFLKDEHLYIGDCDICCRSEHETLLKMVEIMYEALKKDDLYFSSIMSCDNNVAKEAIQKCEELLRD